MRDEDIIRLNKLNSELCTHTARAISEMRNELNNFELGLLEMAEHPTKCSAHTKVANSFLEVAAIGQKLFDIMLVINETHGINHR
jgi:hypothetical protein